jgi:enamine deaminase RidA (YjgF/YER057c/UK114 family)
MREAIVTTLWQDFYDATGIPAATRIGQTVRLSGHTGTRPDGSFPTEAAEQLRQTFENVTDTLTVAGCTWTDVDEITTFHLGLRAQGDLVLRIAAEFMSEPFPAWTALGVTELYEPEAIFELRVVATLRSQDADG